MGRKRIEMAGKRYGKLIAVKATGSDGAGRLLWQCKCDCGKITVVSGQRLRNGNTKSCGCLVKENGTRLPSGMASFNRAFQIMRTHAQKRNYKWELTKEQTIQLMESPCFYCGIPPLLIVFAIVCSVIILFLNQ